MPAQIIKYDKQQPVEIEIKNLSPNVLSYKIFTKGPQATTWSNPIDGDIRSGEAQAEKHSLGLLDDNTELFVSLGFGGKEGGGYKGEVDVLQGGKSVGASGTFFREGVRAKGKKLAVPDPCEGVFRAI